MVEKIVRQVSPACCHEINGLDRTQCNNVIVAPTVTHNANRFNRQKNSKCLTDAVVQIRGTKFINKYSIGETQQVRIFFSDCTENPNTQTRPGERVTINHLSRQAELNTNLAHLVFKQVPQRLNKLEFHIIGQPANVMV